MPYRCCFSRRGRFHVVKGGWHYSCQLGMVPTRRMRVVVVMGVAPQIVAESVTLPWSVCGCDFLRARLNIYMRSRIKVPAHRGRPVVRCSCLRERIAFLPSCFLCSDCAPLWRCMVHPVVRAGVSSCVCVFVIVYLCLAWTVIVSCQVVRIVFLFFQHKFKVFALLCSNQIALWRWRHISVRSYSVVLR